MIVSRHNGTFKDIRRLLRSKGDLARLEGPHLIGEALAVGLAIETALATPEFLATTAGAALGRELRDRGAGPQEIAADLLAELTDADSPKGLLALARLPRSGVAGLPIRAGLPYIYIDGLQDPGNLGALVRVAEAAGAAGVALAPGSVHPNHPRALRGSAGSLLRLPVAVGVSADALAEHLAALCPRWTALEARGGGDLYATALDGTLILALGAEGPGLSPAVRERAHFALTIPLEPPVESLNAVVAAALVLFEIRRRARSV